MSGSAMAFEMALMAAECPPPQPPVPAPRTYAAGPARAEGWVIARTGPLSFAIVRFVPEAPAPGFRPAFRTDADALEHVRRRAEEGSAWHADALRIGGPTNQDLEGGQ